MTREIVDEPRETGFERRVAACAYEFGMTPGDVRAVLCVLLRDALIAAEGRTPPGPKDGNPRYGEAPPSAAGWRKTLGADEAPEGRAGKDRAPLGGHTVEEPQCRIEWWKADE